MTKILILIAFILVAGLAFGGPGLMVGGLVAVVVWIWAEGRQERHNRAWEDRIASFRDDDDDPYHLHHD